MRVKLVVLHFSFWARVANYFSKIRPLHFLMWLPPIWRYAFFMILTNSFRVFSPKQLNLQNLILVGKGTNYYSNRKISGLQLQKVIFLLEYKTNQSLWIGRKYHWHTDPSRDTENLLLIQDLLRRIRLQGLGLTRSSSPCYVLSNYLSADVMLQRR